MGTKKRARSEGVEFSISVSDVAIPAACPVLGIPINIELGRPGVGLGDRPSLDRVDSSKGYVPGNVAVMSWRANMIKNCGTADEHRRIAEWMERFAETGPARESGGAGTKRIEITLAGRHAAEVSEQFLRGMAARMAMSYEKYGAVAEAYPYKLDALASMKVRLARYRETGNTECLMDAANFLMIEFMRPRHPDAHFVAEDSAASPGRVDVRGRAVGAEANTGARENVRLGGSALTTAGGHYRREGD